MGRGKSDDTSLDYYIESKRAKYKGRAKGEDHNLLRRAVEIVEGKTLKEWKREVNISPSEYCDLRYRLIEYEAKGSKGPFASPHRLTMNALTKMLQEIYILQSTLGHFYHELDKAEKEGKPVFLNIVREVFGDKASDSGGPFPSMLMFEACKYIKTPKGRGDKIKKQTILKAYKLFLEWTEGKETLELPKTFYEREKIMGFCHLARRISDILDEPYHRDLYKLTRMRAIKGMQLLIKKADRIIFHGHNSDSQERTLLIKQVENACIEVERALEKLGDI